MDLMTKVDIPSPDFEITYNDNLMMFGSCFAENVGWKFSNYKFSVDVNPFGIVYNPMALLNCINFLLEDKRFTEDNLDFFNEKWFSFYHHGSFSSMREEECLNNINSRMSLASKNFKSLDILIVTWGTSWVYEHIEKGVIVANCHKIPAKQFNRYRLSIDEIVYGYLDVLRRLKLTNTNVKVIFTVSPIRHWKDGAHGNQLSKATLLLAIEKIMEELEWVYYFPSYEIVMDELRDYRFYKDDMLHVSDFSIEYIWNRFSEVFFDKKTLDTMKIVDKINKALAHRPFDKSSDAYKKHVGNVKKEIEELNKFVPSIDYISELDCLTRQEL